MTLPQVLIAVAVVVLLYAVLGPSERGEYNPHLYEHRATVEAYAEARRPVE